MEIVMANKMQTGNANSIRKFWIYLGDADALNSASYGEVLDELYQRLLVHRFINKDGRRKNSKKKKGDLEDNFSIIMVLICKLRQRSNLRNQQRNSDAMNFALRNAAVKNARRSSNLRAGNIIPMGLRVKSQPV